MDNIKNIINELKRKSITNNPFTDETEGIKGLLVNAIILLYDSPAGQSYFIDQVKK